MLLLVPHAHAAEWRSLGGAHLDAMPHGELDLGVREAHWSAELRTDTLDVRWSPTAGWGRATVGLRGELAGAGYMFQGRVAEPLLASHVGPDAGIWAYLPRGAWLGADAAGRLWAFGAAPETDVAVPGAFFVGSGAVSAGWWSREGSLALRGGADVVTPLGSVGDPAAWGVEGPVGEPLSLGVAFEGLFRPRRWVSPRLEVRAGASSGRGAVLATRLGGSMPYSAPLVGAPAGSGWAKDYAAFRFGFLVGSPDAAPGAGAGAEPVEATTRWVGRAGVVADAATWTHFASTECSPDELAFCAWRGWDDHVRYGAGVTAGARRGRFWGSVEGGVAIDPATEDVTTSAALRLGVDWG